MLSVKDLKKAQELLETKEPEIAEKISNIIKQLEPRNETYSQVTLLNKDYKDLSSKNNFKMKFGSLNIKLWFTFGKISGILKLRRGLRCLITTKIRILLFQQVSMTT